MAKNTSLCYLEQGGCWLMLHRVKKQHDENAGKWIGVGGKFEEGESPEECMCREVREETGLCLTAWRCRGIITFVSDVWETEYMHLFTADAWRGSLPQRDSCDEGVLEWVPKSRVPQLPVWEGDKIFLRLLEKNEPFFSLKLVYTGERLTAAWLNGIPLAL